MIGFKSFAGRTVLEFPKSAKDNFSIASVVGPNGSGKSNLVESIRWALGEQSLKILRGKKSQDIIFSGSYQKTRLSLAEVTLLFNNEDKTAPIDYKEFTITRRIYRNGESEYLINKSRVRLQDILILLAKSNFGQKSYSIVGQGLVDQILQTSPLERKKFFDEATGIRQYQIKKDEALRKIDKSQNNLQQSEIALNEIAPHLKSLTRQINKLEKRQQAETKLYQLQKKHYSALWQNLNHQIFAFNQQIDKYVEKQKQIEKELKIIQRQSENLVTEKLDNQYQQVQQQYQKILEQKNECLDKQSVLRAKLIFEKEKLKQQKHQQAVINLDQEKVFSDIKEIRSSQKKFLEKINKACEIKDLEKIKILAQKIFEKITQCLKHFAPKGQTKPSSSDLREKEMIEKFAKEKERCDQEIKNLDKKLNQLNQKFGQFNEKERDERKKILVWQKKAQSKQSELNSLTYKINELKIDLARLETKRDVLREEIQNEMEDNGQKIINSDLTETTVIHSAGKTEDFEQIRKLKHQLELIGNIDPEITKEYPVVRERYEFLTSQGDDLKKSLKSLNKIIQELNQKIKNQFKNNFSQINQEFNRYFKIIFGGGKTKIVLQQTNENSKESEEQDEPLKIVKSNEGIEIFATPPGKKIKSIEMLSGGEKALTSLALICSIVSINKPPFVVFDEVDAALDQENSLRFAKILKELRKNSQFIIITHNQQTIEIADILYGVTMGNDGISRLISLKLEK